MESNSIAGTTTANQQKVINTSISNSKNKIKKKEDLDEKLDDLENCSRRSNLSFDGLTKDINKSWSNTGHKLRDFFVK